MVRAFFICLWDERRALRGSRAPETKPAYSEQLHCQVPKLGGLGPSKLQKEMVNWLFFPSPIFRAGSKSSAATLNKQEKFDCMDAHFVYPDGFAAVLLGKVLGVPVTISARGTDINLFSSFLLIRPMIRWTLKQSAAAIAVSAALKEKMKELDIDLGKIHVIPNGVDAASFQV